MKSKEKLLEYPGKCCISLIIIIVVQLLSHIWLFAKPWTMHTKPPVPHYLLEFAQVHVHWIGDVTQPSHPLSPSSPSALNLSQHQGFSNESALRIKWPKYWGFSFSTVLPKSTQVWFPLILTGLISLLGYRVLSHFTSVVSDSVRLYRQQPTRLPHPWDSPGKNTGVGCHFLLQCMKGKSESEVAQSCLTLSDPMDCSLPGSSIHGTFQARVLEWGAIAFSLT